MSVLFWGRSVCDLTYLVENFPEENSKIFSSDFIIQPGGTALNPAITFAHLSGSANLVSRLGNNNFAQIVEDALKKYNVDVFDLSEDDDFQIPISTIFVNSKNGSRTIINSPKDETVKFPGKEKLYKIIEEINPELILIDGFELEGCYEVLEYCRKKNIKIVFDGGSWKENTNEFLKYVDIAICSSKFAAPGLNIEETIKKLHETGIKFVAFTQDENPIISSIENKKELIPVEKVKAVDTLGAGDVFHGAFCYYFLKSNDFNFSLKEAARDASNSCRYFGTHTWISNQK
ncbi:MAG: hypothetical protein A2068_14925 [Ignavibacteria bacterium GWB2_35_6b]|nr:MAG: hypothetical protein A2068_14925 [Ignavibacteria bacterium GWB2_35_6b]